MEDSDLTDLFLHASTKSDSIDHLLDQEDIEVELRLTDGDSSFQKVLGRADIIKLKHKKNDQTDSEWTTFFLQALFNALPLKSIDTIRLSGKETNQNGAPLLELELKSILGNSISRVLGVLELKPLDSEDVNFADQLFEWSKILSDTNRDLYRESAAVRTESESLKREIEQLKKFQIDLVEQSRQQQRLHLKIMTKLLNSKKDHYINLTKGEIKEDEDNFNYLAIQNAKEEVFKEENDIEPKPKKQRKSPAKGVKRQRGIQKLRKHNKEKEFPQIKAEDEDEFIPDSQDENEPVKKEDAREEIKVKKENSVGGEETNAIKAEPEKSIHFKFQDNEERDEPSEVKVSNDEEMIDATDEDTVADDDTDEDEEELKNRPVSETGTDTQSDTDAGDDTEDNSEDE